jgi:hypothetical protein
MPNYNILIIENKSTVFITLGFISLDKACLALCGYYYEYIIPTFINGIHNYEYRKNKSDEYRSFVDKNDIYGIRDFIMDNYNYNQMLLTRAQLKLQINIIEEMGG